jgi:hypothetical protein
VHANTFPATALDFVMQLFYVVGKARKRNSDLHFHFASQKEASESHVLLQHSESPFRLNAEETLQVVFPEIHNDIKKSLFLWKNPV